jgi:hypothetical protein
MSYPFPMHTPQQYPPLMEQVYTNQPVQYFQSQPPRSSNPGPAVSLIHFDFFILLFFKNLDPIT